ncbi:helix-turn-helix domain-containing protein [Roseovarius sp. C7]|uniref:helix-turn-helix domain-containing protein n=1 Tax=Roseovarius sp. C7 TaxID=3398643 RepID=UPI0039F70661
MTCTNWPRATRPIRVVRLTRISCSIGFLQYMPSCQSQCITSNLKYLEVHRFALLEAFVNLSFRQLQTFREVMRANSLSEAARSLGRTQPAVSAMIASLSLKWVFGFSSGIAVDWSRDPKLIIFMRRPIIFSVALPRRR